MDVKPKTICFFLKKKELILVDILEQRSYLGWPLPKTKTNVNYPCTDCSRNVCQLWIIVTDIYETSEYFRKIKTSL